MQVFVAFFLRVEGEALEGRLALDRGHESGQHLAQTLAHLKVSRERVGREYLGGKQQ